MDRYEVIRELGRGSFGYVQLCADLRKNGDHVSLKTIALPAEPSSSVKDQALNEATVLKGLENRFIVRYYESFFDIDQEDQDGDGDGEQENKEGGKKHEQKIRYLRIAMEYCPNGDLAGLLKRVRCAAFGLPCSVALLYSWQLAVALEYVHGKKILHRDLKPRNIFLSHEWSLRLGDFGVCRVQQSTGELASTMIGTPLYLSPEICSNTKYDEKSDVWGLGAIAFEMFVGHTAFGAVSGAPGNRNAGALTPAAIIMQIATSPLKTEALTAAVGKLEQVGFSPAGAGACGAGSVALPKVPSFKARHVVNAIAQCLAKRANRRPTATTAKDIFEKGIAALKSSGRWDPEIEDGVVAGGSEEIRAELAAAISGGNEPPASFPRLDRIKARVGNNKNYGEETSTCTTQDHATPSHCSSLVENQPAPPRYARLLSRGGNKNRRGSAPCLSLASAGAELVIAPSSGAGQSGGESRRETFSGAERCPGGRKRACTDAEGQVGRQFAGGEIREYDGRKDLGRPLNLRPLQSARSAADLGSGKMIAVGSRRPGSAKNLVVAAKDGLLESLAVVGQSKELVVDHRKRPGSARSCDATVADDVLPSEKQEDGEKDDTDKKNYEAESSSPRSCNPRSNPKPDDVEVLSASSGKQSTHYSSIETQKDATEELEATMKVDLPADLLQAGASSCGPSPHLPLNSKPPPLPPRSLPPTGAKPRPPPNFSPSESPGKSSTSSVSQGGSSTTLQYSLTPKHEDGVRNRPDELVRKRTEPAQQLQIRAPGDVEAQHDNDKQNARGEPSKGGISSVPGAPAVPVPHAEENSASKTKTLDEDALNASATFDLTQTVAASSSTAGSAIGSASKPRVSAKISSMIQHWEGVMKKAEQQASPDAGTSKSASSSGFITGNSQISEQRADMLESVRKAKVERQNTSENRSATVAADDEEHDSSVVGTRNPVMTTPIPKRSPRERRLRLTPESKGGAATARRDDEASVTDSLLNQNTPSPGKAEDDDNLVRTGDRLFLRRQDLSQFVAAGKEAGASLMLNKSGASEVDQSTRKKAFSSSSRGAESQTIPDGNVKSADGGLLLETVTADVDALRHQISTLWRPDNEESVSVRAPANKTPNIDSFADGEDADDEQDSVETVPPHVLQQQSVQYRPGGAGDRCGERSTSDLIYTPADDARNEQLRKLMLEGGQHRHAAKRNAGAIAVGDRGPRGNSARRRGDPQKQAQEKIASTGATAAKVFRQPSGQNTLRREIKNALAGRSPTLVTGGDRHGVRSPSPGGGGERRGPDVAAADGAGGSQSHPVPAPAVDYLKLAREVLARHAAEAEAKRQSVREAGTEGAGGGEQHIRVPSPAGSGSAFAPPLRWNAPGIAASTPIEMNHAPRPPPTSNRSVQRGSPQLLHTPGINEHDAAPLEHPREERVLRTNINPRVTKTNLIYSKIRSLPGAAPPSSCKSASPANLNLNEDHLVERHRAFTPVVENNVGTPGSKILDDFLASKANAELLGGTPALQNNKPNAWRAANLKNSKILHSKPKHAPAVASRIPVAPPRRSLVGGVHAVRRVVSKTANKSTAGSGNAGAGLHLGGYASLTKSQRMRANLAKVKSTAVAAAPSTTTSKSSNAGPGRSAVKSKDTHCSSASARVAGGGGGAVGSVFRHEKPSPIASPSSVVPTAGGSKHPLKVPPIAKTNTPRISPFFEGAGTDASKAKRTPTAAPAAATSSKPKLSGAFPPRVASATEASGAPGNVPSATKSCAPMASVVRKKQATPTSSKMSGAGAKSTPTFKPQPRGPAAAQIASFVSRPPAERPRKVSAANKIVGAAAGGAGAVKPTNSSRTLVPHSRAADQAPQRKEDILAERRRIQQKIEAIRHVKNLDCISSAVQVVQQDSSEDSEENIVVLEDSD